MEQLILVLILFLFLGIDRYLTIHNRKKTKESNVQIIDSKNNPKNTFSTNKLKQNNVLVIVTFTTSLIFFLNTYFLFLPAEIFGVYIGQLSIIFNLILVMLISGWTFSRRLFVEKNKLIAAEIMLFFLFTTSSLIFYNQIDNYILHIDENSREIRKIYSDNSMKLNNLYAKPSEFFVNFIPEDKLDIAFESDYQVFATTYYQKKDEFKTLSSQEYPMNITDEYARRATIDIDKYYSIKTLYALHSQYDDKFHLTGLINQTLVPEIKSKTQDISKLWGIDEKLCFVLLTLILLNLNRAFLWSLRTLIQP